MGDVFPLPSGVTARKTAQAGNIIIITMRLNDETMITMMTMIMMITMITMVPMTRITMTMMTGGTMITMITMITMMMMTKMTMIMMIMTVMTQVGRVRAQLFPPSHPFTLPLPCCRLAIMAMAIILAMDHNHTGNGLQSYWQKQYHWQSYWQ